MNEIQQLRDSNLLLRRTIAFLCAKLTEPVEITHSDIVEAGNPAVEITRNPDGSVTITTKP